MEKVRYETNEQPQFKKNELVVVSFAEKDVVGEIVGKSTLSSPNPYLSEYWVVKIDDEEIIRLSDFECYVIGCSKIYKEHPTYAKLKS
jgi:hypothetical protein